VHNHKFLCCRHFHIRIGRLEFRIEHLEKLKYAKKHAEVPVLILLSAGTKIARHSVHARYSFAELKNAKKHVEVTKKLATVLAQLPVVVCSIIALTAIAWDTSA
jgi:hypothetical protein